MAKTSNPTDDVTQTSSRYDVDKNVDKLIKESYKTEPPQGGMNNHQDVDPRQNTSNSQAKAQDLIKQAQRNTQQGARNYDGTVQEAMGNLKGGVGESAQQIKEGTQKGFKNLKNNLDSTVDQVSKNIQQAVQ